jgi:hypothetical protein
MNNQCLILIGLIFNFIGALFMAFAFKFKPGKGYIEMGQSKPCLMLGIILLAFGFFLQFIGVLLN